MPRTYELTGEHLAFWRERHLCTVTTLRLPRENPDRVALRILITSAIGSV